VLHIFPKLSNRAVSILGSQRHRLQTDSFQGGWNIRIQRAGLGEIALLHPLHDRGNVLPLEGRLSGQQTIERGAKTVDIAARAHQVGAPGGLFGAHVSRRAQRRAHHREDGTIRRKWL